MKWKNLRSVGPRSGFEEAEGGGVSMMGVRLSTRMPERRIGIEDGRILKKFMSQIGFCTCFLCVNPRRERRDYYESIRMIWLDRLGLLPT